MKPVIRRLLLALPGVFVLTTASVQAETDPDYIEQTTQKSTIEVGVKGTSKASAKANEYNGVTGKGARAIANFELRGGGRYDSEDSSRWRIGGNDLGTRSKSLEAEYGLQGSFKINLGYNELRRNASDSFQSPYEGVGTTSLRLPASWVGVTVPTLGAAPNARGLSPDVTASDSLVAGVPTPPTAPQQAAAAAMQAANLPAFTNVDLFTQRTRYSLGFKNQFTERWAFEASVSHERKEGLRAQGAVSRATGAYTSSILPVVIDQHDDKLQLSMSYNFSKTQMQVGYEGSAFSNNVENHSWNLWGAPGTTASMSAAPSNMFHKIYLTGSTEVTPTTRVTTALSYARSTQDERFATDASALLVPTTSANALVINQSASLKAVNRTTRDLTLSAGYKYDLRDNRTPVNIYGFYDNDSAPTGTSPFAYLYPSLVGLGQNFNLIANTPQSKRTHDINLELDYKFSSSHKVKIGADANRTDRYCRGTWVGCSNAASGNENTLRADWFSYPSENVTMQIGLASSRRKVDRYNEDAWLALVPMAGQTPSTATGTLAGTTAYGTLVALGLTGYGPVSGLTPAAAAGSALAFYYPLNGTLSNALYGNATRLNELVGMRRYYLADRNRNKLRANSTWQVTNAWSLQGGIEGSQDSYSDSVYGLQKAHSWAANLDVTFAPTETTSVSVFTSLEEQRSRTAGNTFTASSAATAVNGATAVSGGCYATIADRNANAKIDPCLDWQSTQRDRTATLGMSLARNKLVGGKLDLLGSFVFTEGRTLIDVAGGSYVNNPYAGVVGHPTAAIAAYYIPATALPTTKAQSMELRLGGTYRVGKESGLRLALGYQRLRLTDWAYEGYGLGGSQQVLPTRETLPDYGVTSLGLSWISSFR